MILTGKELSKEKTMLHQYSYILGLLKLFFYKIIMGKRLKMYGRPSLSHKASLRVRKNSKIILYRHSHFAEGTLLRVTDNAEFSMGINSGFNSYCVITCRHKITIGNNVMFGPFVTIHDHDHVYKTEGLMNESGYTSKPIVIEDNVWIGGNVTILKGVTIGTGSVIAAGTVVAKDVAPHTIIYNQQQIVERSIEL